MRWMFIQALQTEFKGYDGKKFQQDLLAAITVTAVALPLALAFGVGSVGSASAGLITAILSGIIIGSLSGCSFQISGPTGAMTAILILLFQKYGFQGVWIAGVMSGVLLILAGFLKLGKIVSYIPSPVVTGFTSGIAVIIAVGQIDNFFGIKTATADSTAIKLMNYFKAGITPNWWAVLLAAIVIFIMVLWPKSFQKFAPSSLVGLVCSLLVSLIFKLPVEVIGEIPKTLLPATRLNLASLNLETVSGLLIPALSIAALAMIESLLCGQVGGNMKGEKLNVNQELIAQGVGNIIIPFFGGVPATAAIARTSVAIKSGGKTRLVSVLHAVGLFISMFYLAPVMSKIPLASLAGVLMVTAWRMNEWENIRFIFSKRFKSAISKYLITMIATVVFDLTQAILIGVIFSSFMFMFQITNNMEITIHTVDERRLVEKHNMKITKSLSYMRIVYFSGPIFFATVEQLHNQLSELQDVKLLVLSMRGVPLIDTSGINALEALNKQLAAGNCKLMLSGVQKQVLLRLERSGFIDEIGKDMVFWSAEQAIGASLEG